MTAIQIHANTLKKIIKTVAPARSRDYGRPVLCGINLRFKNGQARFVATDSYALHAVTLDYEFPDMEDCSILLDGDWLDRWSKMRWPDTAMAELSWQDKEQCIRILTERDGTLIEVSGIKPDLPTTTTEYPNVDTFLSSITLVVENPNNVHVNPKLLSRGLAACHNWSTYNPIRLVALYDSLKPMQFQTRATDLGLFQFVLMPVRVP